MEGEERLGTGKDERGDREEMEEGEGENVGATSYVGVGGSEELSGKRLE